MDPIIASLALRVEQHIEEGRQAFRAFRSPKDNPHTEGTAAWQAWRSGWYGQRFVTLEV